MITYHHESNQEALDNIEDVFENQWGKDQWDEVGLNAACVQDVPMEVNWATYKTLLDAGALEIFTVRDKGDLVGYYMSVVANDITSRTMVVAQNDTLYLEVSHRKGLTGYKLVKYAVEELKKIADIIMIDMDIHKTFFPLTERLGFKLVHYRVMLEV